MKDENCSRFFRSKCKTREHELKINIEQELLMIHLNLKLEETTKTEQNIPDPSKQGLTYA